MTVDDVTPAKLRATAGYLAWRWYQARFPARGADAAVAWASDHWDQFTDAALDFLAVSIAMAEKEAGALPGPGPAAVNPSPVASAHPESATPGPRTNRVGRQSPCR